MEHRSNCLKVQTRDERSAAGMHTCFFVLSFLVTGVKKKKGFCFGFISGLLPKLCSDAEQRRVIGPPFFVLFCLQAPRTLKFCGYVPTLIMLRRKGFSLKVMLRSPPQPFPRGSQTLISWSICTDDGSTRAGYVTQSGVSEMQQSLFPSLSSGTGISHFAAFLSNSRTPPSITPAAAAAPGQLLPPPTPPGGICPLWSTPQGPCSHLRHSLLSL